MCVGNVTFWYTGHVGNLSFGPVSVYLYNTPGIMCHDTTMMTKPHYGSFTIILYALYARIVVRVMQECPLTTTLKPTNRMGDLPVHDHEVTPMDMKFVALTLVDIIIFCVTLLRTHKSIERHR